jgi:hypothetical protein
MEVYGSQEYQELNINTRLGGYFKIVEEYNGGHMTSEQVKRLGDTYTISEVNNLIAEAFGTVEAVFDEVHEYAESLGGDEA